MREFENARATMLDRQLRRRGISDKRVLAAMAAVPREDFVPPDLAERSYVDSALPIGNDQTISQPFIVALMLEAAEIGPEDRVLEVGTGSGYAAAVLGRLSGSVWTLERHGALFEAASAKLTALGADNVHCRHGDGGGGWIDHAPYDAILVTAAGPSVPQALEAQLRIGGRLVLPLGDRHRQHLVKRTKIARGKFREDDLGPVAFVPLVSEAVHGTS